MTSTRIAEKPLRQVQTIQELLVNDMAKQQLQVVAATHMKPERMMRLMANAIRTTPKLGQCDPLTLLGSMMTCASLGLEPNTVLGHAYLIPFENRKKGVTEVQLVLGYKGMIDLARRSGHVVNIHADVVYEADEFSFEYGSNQHLKHIPGVGRAKPTHAYCHAKLTDGEAFIVLPYAEVLKVRDASQGYKAAIQYGKKDNPWIAHEHQMARKTAVRALFNELPISIEKVSDALTLDDNKANFANFAMHPDQDMPETGETIEGEATEEEVDETPDPASKPEKETKPQKKPAAKPDPEKKPEQKSAPEPEPDEQEAPDEGSSEFAGLAEKIIGEINDAPDLGALEATLEIWGAQIEQLQETDFHAQVMDAADMQREALANG